MNVASLENCKELYELSGWRDCSNTFELWEDSEGKERYTLSRQQMFMKSDLLCPAYDLSYLLRKLPHSTNGGKWRAVLQKEWHNGNGAEYWFASYVHINSMAQFQPISEQKALHITEGDTPEDAVARLCCELIKQGVL